MILISSVCYAILLVIFSSNRSTSATGHDRIKEWDGFWTEQEKIDLMMSWYKVYRGIGYKDYTKKLLEEYGQTPSGLIKERHRDSLTHKANELLREGFTIPAEESGGEPIKLNVEVKHERDRASLAHKANSSVNKKGNIIVKNSVKGARDIARRNRQNPTKVHADNVDIMNESNFDQKKESCQAQWTKEEDRHLMTIWNEVYRGVGHCNYGKCFVARWNESPFHTRKRSGRSLANRVQLLLNKGYTIPASHNNEEEIRLDMNVKRERDMMRMKGKQQQKTSYVPWTKEDDKHLMEIRKRLEDKKTSKIVTKHLVEEWRRTAPGYKERTSGAVIKRAEWLKTLESSIPAEADDKTEAVSLRKKSSRGAQEPSIPWSKEEDNSLMEVYNRLRQMEKLGSFQRDLVREWERVNPKNVQRTPSSVIQRAQKLSRRRLLSLNERNVRDELRNDEPFTGVKEEEEKYQRAEKRAKLQIRNAKSVQQTEDHFYDSRRHSPLISNPHDPINLDPALYNHNLSENQAIYHNNSPEHNSEITLSYSDQWLNPTNVANFWNYGEGPSHFDHEAESSFHQSNNSQHHP